MSSEEYTSEEAEDGGAADFAGSLQTSLCWDLGNKQLGLKLRQNVENGRKVAFKWKVRPRMTFPCAQHAMHPPQSRGPVRPDKIAAKRTIR